jgi:hypothetical protein
MMSATSLSYHADRVRRHERADRVALGDSRAPQLCAEIGGRGRDLAPRVDAVTPEDERRVVRRVGVAEECGESVHVGLR